MTQPNTITTAAEAVQAITAGLKNAGRTDEEIAAIFAAANTEAQRRQDHLIDVAARGLNAVPRPQAKWYPHGRILQSVTTFLAIRNVAERRAA